MKRFLLALGLISAISGAHAQSVQQSGSVTPNTSVMWNGTGVVKGGNTATDSPLTTFGVTRDAVDGICVSSARSTAAGRNQLCLQAATAGPAKISLQNYGTATAQDLQFVINGVAATLPSGGGTFITGTPPYTVGHAACFNSTSGVIQDCGVSVGAGTLWGIPYYSTTSTLTSSPAAIDGQIFLGQTAAAPTWTTLNGDVASVSASGALTLQKVNGIPFPFTFTAHAVLLGNAAGQFGTSITSNVGQCFISQGLNADPIWASCASGSGSAGGSNTQVQFNNSTALAGSANLTWVSPTLTIGVAAGGTGSLALAGSTSGIVSIQPQAVAGTYNLNLPTTAGTSGQPLISGGGSASPMTFGTLGILGGGTNCAVASGLCLDNITGFSSVGYVRRAGGGAYTQVTPIPVSDGGTNLASGTSGGVLAYTASGTLASSGLLTQFGVVLGGGIAAVPTSTAAGTNGQLLIGQTAAAPTWNTASGDIATISTSGAVTIANSAITVAKQANAAAYSLEGNFTGSSTAPQFSTIGSLTQKASPASTDLLLIQDQASSGQLKFATVSSIAAAGSVGSIAGNTGAFTLGAGLTNSVNNILMLFDPASITNCTLTGVAFGNALTVAIKTQLGADPTSTTPCVVSFASATAGTGDYTAVLVTAATSFVTGTTGSTFGSSNNVPFRLWVVAINNAGTVVLGVIKATTATAITGIDEDAPYALTTACNACTNASSAGVIYSTAAQTTKAIRVLGYMTWESGLATAGVWSGSPTSIRMKKLGTPMPGTPTGNANSMACTPNTTTTNATASFVASSASISLTPRSAANLVSVSAYGTSQLQSGNAAVITGILRGGTLVGNTQVLYPGGAAAVYGATSPSLVDFPQTTASTTWAVGIRAGSAGPVAAFGGVVGITDSGCGISVYEIMG